MAADAVLARELKDLHAELTSRRSERSPSAGDRTSVAPDEAVRAIPPEESAEEQQLKDELREFIDTATEFIEEAEKNLSAHPAATVVGALLAGILIGRLLGRR